MNLEDRPEWTFDPRASRRHRVALPATMKLADGIHDCVIEEISLTGAHVAAPVIPASGASGLLLCHMLDILFTVVRVEGYRVALRFDEQIEAEIPFDPFAADSAEREMHNRRFFRLLATGDLA